MREKPVNKKKVAFFKIEFFEDLLRTIIISSLNLLKLYLSSKYFKSNYLKCLYNILGIVNYYYQNFIVPFLEIIFYIKKTDFSTYSYLNLIEKFNETKTILILFWVIRYPLKPLALYYRIYLYNLIYG